MPDKPNQIERAINIYQITDHTLITAIRIDDIDFDLLRKGNKFREGKQRSRDMSQRD
jgi:hypothetical protein